MKLLKNQIHAFIKQQEFPSQAIESLLSSLDKLCEGEQAQIFQSIVKDYQENYRIKYDVMEERFNKMATLSGVHEKQVMLLVYIGLVESLKQHYIDNGTRAHPYPINLLPL